MNRQGQISGGEFLLILALLGVVAALFLGRELFLAKPSQVCAGMGSVCYQGAPTGSGKDCCRDLTCTENVNAPGTYACQPG